MVVSSLLARVVAFLCVIAPAFAAEMTGLSSDDRQSIELACIIAKSEGPAAYHTCLNGQLARLGNGRAPDLTLLSSGDRQSTELACIIAKSEGPAAYHTCLNGQLARLGNGRAPDLTSLSSDDRQSIELACIIAKSEGPAAYHTCLNGQLASLGYAISNPQPRSGAQSPPASVSAPRPPAVDGREIVASGSWGKGCYVEASSNGQAFRMLLDTGASGTLTFGLNHAKQLGFEPSELNFDHSYGSANGEGHYASIRLREFRLETFIMRDVEADITQAPQSMPLLGVELLHRLHLHLKDGNCILTVPRA